MINLQSWSKNFNQNLIAFFVTTLFLTVIGVIIYAIVPENLDINFIQNIFALQPTNFVSEKAERLTYILDTLLFIPVFYLSFLYTKKFIKIKNDVKFLNNFSIFITIFLIIFLIIAIPFGLHFYFKFGSKDIVKLLFFLIISIICYCFKNKPIINTKKFTILSLLFLTVYIFKILIFYPTHVMDQSFMAAFHFEAFSYPIYKVEQGLLLGLDIRNIYGYYPYFYALFANVLGSLNTFKITFLTTIILLISWSCGIFYIYKVTRNKLFAFLLSIVFIYLTGGNFSYYLQFAPLRIIAFTILLFIATLYVQKQKKYLIFLGFLTTTLALVWNFETGFINLIAWTAFLIYTLFNVYSLKNRKIYYISITYILVALISFCMAFIIFKIVPYIVAGKTVNLNAILFSQLLFYKAGFMMKEINPLHPWFLPIIVYAMALILALQPILKNEKNTNRNLSLLVFISIFGLGIYTYYQGRSFLDNLIAVSFPAILIFPILTKKIYNKILCFTKEDTENIKNLFLFIHCTAYIFITFSAIFMLFFVFILNAPKNYHLKQEWPIREKTQYLAKLVKDRNPIIFTLDSAYYYKALNKKDNFPFEAPVDFHLKEDYKNLFAYLDETKTPIILDKEQISRLQLFYLEGFKDFIRKTKYTQIDEFVLFEYKD